MKKTVDIKYPHSANLFQFCRKVLDHKFGGIRVIDQDVGQILGFDPADCSHWKKGKKNIRSIQAMKSIADHLGIDERLVVDVAAGELDDTEAFYEYSGYGAFVVDSKVFESAKKDFFRRHSGQWTKDRELDFKDQFTANEAYIDEVVTAIHKKINFQEAPLYLPEVVAAYPDLILHPMAQGKESKLLTEDPVLVTVSEDKTHIAYIAGSEVRPYMRYRIAKGMAEYFLNDTISKSTQELTEYAHHMIDVQSNVFAAKLLVPLNILRKEMAQITPSKDVVSQLSDIFWVSKTFINRRLKDILQGNVVL